jgi:hypothetical protein
MNIEGEWQWWRTGMGSMAQNKKSKSKIEISEGQKIFRNRKTKFRCVKKFFETEKRNFDGSKNFSKPKNEISMPKMTENRHEKIETSNPSLVAKEMAQLIWMNIVWTTKSTFLH